MPMTSCHRLAEYGAAAHKMGRPSALNCATHAPQRSVNTILVDAAAANVGYWKAAEAGALIMQL